MPTAHEVNHLTTELHTAKIINADTSVGTIMKTAASGLTNPGTLAGWYAVGGEHFVIVCGAQNPGDIAELGAAKNVKRAVSP